jgi:DNA invertase Pin-like site-specific DNA recombinase
MTADRLMELVKATTDANLLVALDAVARIRREVNRLEAVLVRRARNQGLAWTEIAAALGISKQAVHKKYAARGLFGGRR